MKRYYLIFLFLLFYSSISHSAPQLCRVNQDGFERYGVGTHIDFNSVELLNGEWRQDGHGFYALRMSWGVTLICYPVSSCPSGTQLNQSTGVCEQPEEDVCESLKAKDAPPPSTPFPPSDRPITAPRLYCNTSNHCEAMRSYSNSGGELVRSFFYTGNKCVGEKGDFDDNPHYGEPDEPIEPEEPTEPTDPTEPEEPTDPTDPTNPIDPVDPTDPTNPTEPTDPTNPTEPTEPTQPEPLPDPTNPVPENPPFQGGAGSNPAPPIDTVAPPSIPSPPPYQGNDEGIIQAVHATNRNLSNLISQSTNKNIEGFNALNAQLFSLHKTTDNVGQSIVDLMNQDIKIAENNKLLMQQQTTEITKSVNSLSETITNANAQSSEQIVSAIGQASDKQADSLNEFGDSLGEKLDGLFDESTDGIIDAIGQASSGQIAATNQVSESIAGLSESIAGLEFGQPCDPNKDSRSCEGEHGLSTGYIERIYDETIQSAMNIDDRVTAEYLEKIAQEASSERFQPLEKEGRALVGLFIDLLPASQPCDFDTLQFGKFTFQMTCDSVQFLKDILSFVFYLYTVYALMNILLDQVTPHGVPYMSRRM
ncbi:hypothetical protein [Vibrio sp. V33_P6A3T137]|uniref:hypothetical protein n=1 Tax=Vibrio sp. V33_P6A3T137 TaxID=1938685 RepID=UPI001F3B058F|nr:hypothetical protein [Vibrio sp. V33_P6A3T137]